MFKNIFWILTLCLTLYLSRNFLSKESQNFPILEKRDYLGKVFLQGGSYPLIIKDGKFIAVIKKNERPAIITDKVELILNGRKSILTGENKKGKFLGHVKVQNEKIGTWYLEKKELKREKINNSIDLELAKNFYLTRNKKLKLEEKLNQIKSNNALLKKSLINKSRLKRKIKNDSINLKLEKSIKENKKLIRNIEKYQSQLVQVNRISKTGRFIELNRRTNSRENSWYLNNWGEFNNYQYELAVAKKMRISRGELKRKLKLVQNYLSLKTQIRKENDLISNLNSNTYIEPSNDNSVTKERVEAPKFKTQKKEKKSFWKKVGDIFR